MTNAVRMAILIALLLAAGVGFAVGYFVGRGPGWVLWENRGATVHATTEFFSTQSGCQRTRAARCCKDWRTLLNADAAHGRRVLRDLRIERVIVRRDDDGIWSYQLRGALDKLIGGRFFEVPNQVGATWEIEVEVPDSQVDSLWCPLGDSNTRHAV
jgi:hypothetical protein